MLKIKESNLIKISIIIILLLISYLFYNFSAIKPKINLYLILDLEQQYPYNDIDIKKNIKKEYSV